MATPEVLVGRTWLSLSQGADCPRVAESSTLTLRGLDRAETVILGLREERADRLGCIELRLRGCAELHGHLGRVEVRRESGATAGEFEIVPDKMSEDAFQTLRSALERMWAGLIFDPAGSSRLRGQLPSPAELWRAIEKPVRDIAAEPRSILARGEGVRRLEAVRRPSELTSSVIRASASMARRAGGHDDGPSDPTEVASQAVPVQRPGRSSVMIREVDIPENALVAETLRRLASYARRQPDGFEIATRANRALRNHPFVSCRTPRGGIEAARVRTLHDPRYRQVDKVLRLLDSPEAHTTEGPGEARLGVKGMIRLYEYWVFLQVLDACRRQYGIPGGAGLRHPWLQDPRRDHPAGDSTRSHRALRWRSARRVRTAYHLQRTRLAGTGERATSQPRHGAALDHPRRRRATPRDRPCRRRIRRKVRGPALGRTPSSQDSLPLLPHPLAGQARRSQGPRCSPSPRH